MPRFAQGKHAYAISDRSGFRYLYRDMRKEWNGLLVGPDEYEPKQPQLGPFRTVSDAQALKDARPDRKEPLTVSVGPGGFPERGVAIRAIASVGEVTVTT
jgi:hypothetical protein